MAVSGLSQMTTFTVCIACLPLEVKLCCGVMRKVVTQPSKNKRQTSADNETPVSKRAKKEEEMDRMKKDLSKMHGDKYTEPLYKLWARLIVSGQHTSMEVCPAIPLFGSEASKAASRKEKASNPVEVLADAAIKVIDHLKTPGGVSQEKKAPFEEFRVFSPENKVQIRSQYIHQLKELQMLHDEETLSFDEFTEEKARVMATLRAMN